MIEMELKALLKNKSQVIQKLENFGCEWIFVGLQEDTIYEKKNINQIVDTPVFRIRRCKDKKILTLKVLKEDFNTAEELELNISDEKIMDKILQTIDFLPKIQIKKKRKTTKYKGFNICVDEVIGLGDFIEVEKISEKCIDKNIIYAEIRKILSELDIEEKDLVKEKYYEMLLKIKEKKDD